MSPHIPRGDVKISMHNSAQNWFQDGEQLLWRRTSICSPDTSFLITVHKFADFDRRLAILRHDISSVYVTSPLCMSHLLCVCHISSGYVISPLCMSRLLCVYHVSSTCVSRLLCVCHVSSVFITSPLCMSYLLCVCHISFVYVTSPLCM